MSEEVTESPAPRRVKQHQAAASEETTKRTRNRLPRQPLRYSASQQARVDALAPELMKLPPFCDVADVTLPSMVGKVVDKGILELGIKAAEQAVAEARKA